MLVFYIYIKNKNILNKMSDFTAILAEIQTNLPDNNTQAITAEKLRDTLTDLTIAIEDQQDGFETYMTDTYVTPTFASNQELANVSIIDNLNSTSSTDVLSAKQGKILDEKIPIVESYYETHTISDWGYVSAVSGSEGTIVTNTQSYKMTDYIPVSSGQTWIIYSNASNSVYKCASFDESKTFVSGASSNVVGTGGTIPASSEVTIPSGVSYIIVSGSVTFSPDANGKTFREGILNDVDTLNKFVDDSGNLKWDGKDATCVLTTRIISNNIANPNNVLDNAAMNNDGRVIVRSNLQGYKVCYIEVTPGMQLTVGGNDCGRDTYYSFWSNYPTPGSTTYLISMGTASRQNMIDGKTLTVPEGAYYLFYQIQFNGNPTAGNVVIQANLGSELLPYDTYEIGVASINGVPVATGGGDVPAGLESRLETIEGDIEDLQTYITNLDNSSLIVDLPTSAGGAGITVGNAYIDSTTGVVTVKLS